ncbi:MAG: dicarboxylate/amino acid:cation symporter [Alphaproteobacteria bacterium]
MNDTARNDLHSSKPKKQKIELWVQVLIGLVLGVIVGRMFPDFAASNLKWLGQLFIDLIMMVIVPLVFFSIVSGVVSLGDPKTLGRMGAKAIFGYVATTMVAILLAFVLANTFQPGVGVSEDIMQQLNFNIEQSGKEPAETETKEAPDVTDILLGIVPKNAIGAMAERNILQVIFFAIFVGATMVLMRGQTPLITNIVNEAAEIFYKIIEIIIRLAPYAVFGLTAWVVSALGLDAIMSLLLLVVTVVTACILQYVMMLAVLAVFGRLSPWPFMRKSLPYQLIAFSTSSSSATIPTTMAVAESKMGVSKTTTAMVIPLGATVNMNGTAIYLAICTLFVAQLMGVDLTMGQYVTVLVTITLLAIGTAAVPGGSLVMMPIVFGTVGLPVAAIGLILGVDRILDMVRTTINVTGDAFVSVMIDKSEGRLDMEMYNAHIAADE